MHNEISEFPFIEVQIQVSNFLAKKYSFMYKCLGMFNYGSVVYGYKKTSDTDVIVIVKHDQELHDQFTITNVNDGTNIDIQAFSDKTFINKMNEHDISVLECIFAPKEHIIVPLNFFVQNEIKNFNIHLGTLRKSISSTCSNSYVKAKKKLIIEEDFNLETSIKSLFHSLRIYDFGTQLATSGTIDDYGSCNWLYKEIVNTYTDTNCEWDKIHEEYKPIFNEFASSFKEVCPK